MDSLIDRLLAVICLSFIIAIIKYGGGIISQLISKLRMWYYGRKYPQYSKTLPIRELKFGNIVRIKSKGLCKYHGKQNGLYYIEALEGYPFDGNSYYYAEENYLRENCDQLSNDKIIKWARCDD